MAAAPAAAAPKRKPARRGTAASPGRRTFSRITWLGLAALTGIVAFGAGTSGGSDTRASRPLRETIDGLALSLGFGIAQVEITGHSFTTDAAINEALDLPSGSSMLSFDSATARRRIEQLPWIDTATVTRLLPDRLQIAVTERRAYARWQAADGTYLIDRTGRVLSALHTGGASHLPLVAGEGAPAAAEKLLQLVERYPAIASRLEAAERIDGRRWTLHLDGNLSIHLPAESEVVALDRVTSAGVTQGLSAMSATVVDVRVPSRMIVSRGNPGPAAAPQPVAPRAATGDGRASPFTRTSREADHAQRG